MCALVGAQALSTQVLNSLEENFVKARCPKAVLVVSPEQVGDVPVGVQLEEQERVGCMSLKNKVTAWGRRARALAVARVWTNWMDEHKTWETSGHMRCTCEDCWRFAPLVEGTSHKKEPILACAKHKRRAIKIH